MASGSGVRRALKGEPSWPSTGDLRPIFLLDASSRLEERVLRAWIARQCPGTGSDRDYDIVRIPPTRRRQRVSLKPLARQTSGIR